MIISLGYHDVVAGNWEESGFPGNDAHRYKFTREEFESHLDSLQQAGAVCGLLGAPTAGAAREFWLTFDDGGAGAVLCASALERRGWRGHFFVATDWIGKPGFLTAPEIAALHRRGHVIGSHSCSHPARLSRESPAFVAREWRESARILSEIIGAPVVCGAVPGGFYSRMVGEAARDAGYAALFTSEPVARETRLGDCRILGRYSVMRGAAPGGVTAIALGHPWPRARQWAYWNCKKVVKLLGGDRFLRFRVKWLARRPA